jgi:hypothetical protein
MLRQSEHIRLSKPNVNQINELMAQTDAGKKKVYVHTYTKDDGTKVPTHYRSTPNTSDGKN